MEAGSVICKASIVSPIWSPCSPALFELPFSLRAPCLSGRFIIQLPCSSSSHILGLLLGSYGQSYSRFITSYFFHFPLWGHVAIPSDSYDITHLLTVRYKLAQEGQCEVSRDWHSMLWGGKLMVSQKISVNFKEYCSRRRRPVWPYANQKQLCCVGLAMHVCECVYVWVYMRI